MENNVGMIVFILAGYNKQMEKFFEHNPGLDSRVPYKLRFADYEDPELLLMFERMVKKKYQGQMQTEEGFYGLYCRIAVRRLGRGRGREGFGNARALENMLCKIGERQAERIGKERQKGLYPDDFMLSKEDLIGPEPSTAVTESPVGRNFSLLQRELLEQKPQQVSLNRVFLGSPGTGKTTVAKLYGQILLDLGLLSNGEVVMKNPADFVGSVLGESESKTKAILASTAGKVLIIDEAYMLYGGRGGTSNQNDIYKTAVIDTIVAEVQSTPGEDRCVLLLGYKEQIVEMFQNVNEGLARRFDIEGAFHFEDFTDAELLEILDLKLKDQDLAATDSGKKVAIEKLFEDVVGCEDIVAKLGGFQETARKMKARNMDPRDKIPTNFIMKGPPGTGKTTTARKIGQVYYDMGFLSSTEVVECSASDLVGQYVGQTGPKTKKLLEKALGRVLFVDEAYRLGDGPFAKEAVDELVSMLTQPRFVHKIVVILAGYDREMNQLLAINTGLSSRFPEEIIFKNMSPAHCLEVLKKSLSKQKIRLEALDDRSSTPYHDMEKLLEQLSELPSWGNARDIGTLAKQMTNLVFTNLPDDEDPSAELTLGSDDALTCMKSMLEDRRERCTNISSPSRPHIDMQKMQQMAPSSPPPPPAIRTTQAVKRAQPKKKQAKRRHLRKLMRVIVESQTLSGVSCRRISRPLKQLKGRPETYNGSWKRDPSCQEAAGRTSSHSEARGRARAKEAAERARSCVSSRRPS
ncbi:Stage V sporulation protein K [Grifola frondosa]|uniref:Stage V sporulation protein K n=1 Tax=Grifola frondosa TaxID=5627 RepID=A0A1C7ML34_GRIFR|nr:Stage V sporulation protein K [Grifola frondosa]